MIEAPTLCYLQASTQGEAAQDMMMRFAPEIALDIEEIKLTSVDFESDIQAINHLDETVKSLVTSKAVNVEEDFNPLYIPAPMSAIDALLDEGSSEDMMKFTAFGGDPFVLKQVKVTHNNDQIALVSVKYYPFELPSYADLSEQHERFHIN